MMTIAEKIAERFGDDGTEFLAPILPGEKPTFEDDPGYIDLDDVCSSYARPEQKGQDARYSFSDGSSIIIIEGVGWDLGIHGSNHGCWCWVGADHGRHSNECPYGFGGE